MSLIMSSHHPQIRRQYKVGIVTWFFNNNVMTLIYSAAPKPISELEPILDVSTEIEPVASAVKRATSPHAQCHYDVSACDFTVPVVYYEFLAAI